MPRVTLGIETSGRSGRIALRIAGEDADERELSQAGRRHAQTLLSEIRDLLRDHRLKPAEIDLAAASHGGHLGGGRAHLPDLVVMKIRL